jgi:predicted ribosomally synthesized peptide with SipW-like signal peptide
MKVLVTALVLCCLAVAGLGGTFATWSDSETSMDNYIETGSVDLRVNNADDAPWGAGVPTKVRIDCMIPCKLYGPYYVDVWNAGQCEFPSMLFLHIKEVCCSNVPAKEGSGYPDPRDPDGIISPEPELVAQWGGKVNCVEVPGIGVLGEDCTLLEHIYMWIVDSETGEIIWDGKMDESVCKEIYLCDLVPCEPRVLEFWFHLQQPTEEDFGMDYIPNDGSQHWAKFNDWPSWALMKDLATFNMEFDLWLVDP